MGPSAHPPSEFKPWPPEGPVHFSLSTELYGLDAYYVPGTMLRAL